METLRTSTTSHQVLSSPQFSKNAGPIRKPSEENASQVEGQQITINRATAPKKESLFIGGMTCSTNLSELQHHLRHLSGSSSGLFISMVNRIKRKSFSGYGIIKNVDPKAAANLLLIKNFKFQGCWYGIKPFLKKKSEISKIRKERAEKKVYLNGIVEDLVENDLEVYFRKYGQVLHVQISKHPGTNDYKGFGFVEFDSLESAQQVLSLHHHEINGFSIVCQLTNLTKTPIEQEKRSTSPSHRSSPSKEPDCKYVADNVFAKEPVNEGNLSSRIPEILKLCPGIYENHSTTNVAFRVCFNA